MRSVIPLNKNKRNIAEYKYEHQNNSDIVFPNEVDAERENAEPAMNKFRNAGFSYKRGEAFACGVVCNALRQHIPHDAAHIGQACLPFPDSDSFVNRTAVFPVAGAIKKACFTETAARQGFAYIMSKNA